MDYCDVSVPALVHWAAAEFPSSKHQMVSMYTLLPKAQKRFFSVAIVKSSLQKTITITITITIAYSRYYVLRITILLLLLHYYY